MKGARRLARLGVILSLVLLFISFNLKDLLADKELFPQPWQLKKAVNFWKKIFGYYTSDKIVIHSVNDYRILQVVEVSDLRNPKWSFAEQEKMIEQRIAPIKKQLKRFQNFSRLRGQVGQRDYFEKALTISGRYLTKLEEIFAIYNLPKELTRLIFIESMFDVEARSAIGAAGLWQFCRATAEAYLKMDYLIDERRDPFYATHAAARLLRHYQKSLGNWALAITAYNTGLTRMLRAKRTLGTTNLVKIINAYQDQNFGFASKNFYAEFLAVCQLYNERNFYFRYVKPHPPQRYQTVKIKRKILVQEIAQLYGISPKTVAAYNPMLRGRVIQSDLYLPPGFNLKLPINIPERVLAQEEIQPKKSKFKKSVEDLF